jgi:acylphosphatase
VWDDRPVRRVHVSITGRVQGVFFRATCARRAADLGLAGWVRNAEDGSVEAVFEGASDAVESMQAWCAEGPSGARVEDVAVTEESPTGEQGFRVVG